MRTQKLNQATGHHFNLPGHSLADLKVIALEKYTVILFYRKERESYLIRKFTPIIALMAFVLLTVNKIQFFSAP